MSARWIALALGVFALASASLATAEPVIKPRKYFGPIPQSMLWLRAGMLGGASNEEMNAYLDDLIDPPFAKTTDDFGTSLAVEAGYARKPHPQFGVRLNTVVSFLNSESDGNKDPLPPVPDSVLVNYHREFKVQLIVVEASGIYFFNDASVKEFQTYVGGGFSVGFPHESYEETQIDDRTLEPVQTIEESEWGVSAGVHAVLGVLYYVTNTFGITAEARLQMMEGRFDGLEAQNETGGFEDVSFVVDYTGFYLTVGGLWGF